MSLIVGRTENGKVILLGDSKLTYKYRDSNPYLDGCLKLYILSPQLAFGFSGIVEHFEQALPNFLNAIDASELIKIAQEVIQKKKFDFDLIVAQAGENEFYLLKEGQISRSSVGYVGDKEGFEAYQKAYTLSEPGYDAQVDRAYISFALQPEPEWRENQYGRMTSAFNAVLKNEDIKTVGGILVPLCTHKGVFEYMTYSNAISDPFEITKVMKSGKPIDFGTAEHGSFSVELCDTSPHGGSCKNIGFYFLQGGFGVVFPPNSNGLRRSKIVKAFNPAIWVLNTSKVYGNGVASSYMTPDHCGIAGESLMQEQKWKDALYCYELGKDAKDLKERTAVFDRYMSGYAVSMFNVGQQEDAIALLEKLVDENSSLPLCVEYLFRLRQAVWAK